MLKALRTIVLLLALGALLAALFNLRPLVTWWRSRPFGTLIRQTAAREKIDPRLLYALVWQESRFDPWRVGQAGEIGLMQITTNAAKEWAARQKTHPPARIELFDPRTNLTVGAWYLGRALRRWAGRDDPVPFALAEYNAGPSNAQRWYALEGGHSTTGFMTVITYPGTRKYIEDIRERAKWVVY